MNIKIYTPKDFQKLRRAGKLASQTLDYVAGYIKPGVSTERLNQICHDFIVKNGAKPAPLNYHGFPKSICTSINEVICHGIPSSEEVLKEGDIVNIDVTVIKKGYYGDTSRTFIVGKASKKAETLVKDTEKALMDAIGICRPGTTLADIGKTIQDYAEAKGYSVVRDYCGHGIGTVFHEDPNILHYYTKEMEKVVLQEGMVFTIEPMINLGVYDGITDENDGWTVRTADGKLSAQFEHTIGITADGVEIFTKTA
jgi:methionyl aminopeptidase